MNSQPYFRETRAVFVRRQSARALAPAPPMRPSWRLQQLERQSLGQRECVRVCVSVREREKEIDRERERER